ncbi:MAG TPA: M56 family metallopeptidase [Acidobacteriaceae bacterium]|nr:M56 family metallopeptidase [Acidobacteriaceae bacterium]
MTHLELTLLNYLLNSLWQTPVIFLFAVLAARITASAGPRTQHRIWVTALILEALLPACAFGPSLRGMLLSFMHSAHSRVTTQTTLLGVTAPAPGSPHLVALAESVALVAYIAASLYFAVRLAVRLHRTRALRHTAQPIVLTGEPLALWNRCARIFGIDDAHLAASAHVVGPSTIGIRRRTILVPPTLLTSISCEDLAAALAHEFAHMRRRDFARNLLYEFIALPIAWHPLLWLTRLRIAESREMVCDEIAARATHGATRYAHSLLRLAESFSRPTPAATLHAIGILDANVLERRVMKLTRIHSITAVSRRAAIIAAVALGIATCASAMSLRLEVPTSAILSAHTVSPAPAFIASGSQQPDGPIRVAGGIAAGQIISKVDPIYPPIARAAGIAGAVVLHAIIGADGTIQQLAVISGPPMLVGSAMDAVRQWVYKPYLLNGEPVKVDTTITVNYSLDPQKTPPPPPPPSANNAREDTYQITGTDGEVYNVGGSVRPPVAIYAPDPEYTEAARKAKLSGNVIVSLVVDSDGEPQNVRVARGLGNELDEKAVGAVQQYKFKPATRNGEPVSTYLNIAVNFQIF